MKLLLPAFPYYEVHTMVCPIATHSRRLPKAPPYCSGHHQKSNAFASASKQKKKAPSESHATTAVNRACGRTFGALAAGGRSLH